VKKLVSKYFTSLQCVIIFNLFAASFVHAQNATWVGTTSDINTASNWSPSGVPSSGNTYTFDNTGITTTVTGNPAAGVLIVVNSSSGVKDYTISGVLSGATTVTKNGSSRLTLTGTNTYNGITNVNAGILNIQNNAALGNTTNGTIISSGAKLQLQNNITVTGEALTLNGGSFVSATGGAITYSGAYIIHTFTNSGTFSVSSGGTVEYLIVGGGGGGLGSDDGGEGGGGGGAGGVVYGSGTRTPGSYTVTVGAGGAGGIIENDATRGSNSVFGTLTAQGGGGSTRQEAVPATANAGGSGAGGFGRGEAAGNATQPGSGSGGFGNAGGNGGTNPGGGGGGGGANSAGSTGGANNGGNGGGGNTYNISGASVAYAGGGGGGVRLSGTAGTASAGGGAGGTAGNVGSNATANTGGGGGGGGGNGTTYQRGGDGGSGVVILRYLNSGALENVSGDNYWTGTVALLADNIITSTTGTLTVSGVISGAFALTKNGGGKLTLSGANTYSGATNVNAGILNIQNNAALGNTANGTIVSSGAKLQIQNNITVTGESLTLNGGSFVFATGGALTTSGDYIIHTFSSSGAFSASSGGTVEYLVIGGGGGGGGGFSSGNWSGGGGGGAGGYRSSVAGESSGGGNSAESALMLGVGSHSIVVGGGGSGGSVTNNGTNGFDSYIQNPSSVDLVRSAGGGGGAGAQSFIRRDGLAGGSGGAAAGGQGTGGIGGLGTTSQGYNGGLNGTNRGSGGGGGAGGNGINSAGAGFDGYNNYAKAHGGTGGPGVFSAITGALIQRGGGGGGGCDETANYLPGIGGLGGGGTGGNPTGTAGSPATANTGGGGGGGTQSAGGSGGSGVVILRYLNSGALENVSGDNYWTGTVTLLADNIITTTTGTLTVSGIISGAYALTKNGSGTLTFSNANTHSGGTALNNGKLNINNASALGASAGTFTINGGTIDNTSGGTITTGNHPQLWNQHFTFAGTNNLNLGAGAVSMSASRQLTTTANTLFIGGVINDNTKSLTKAGAGTLAFGAQAVTINTLTINAGSLTSTSGTLNLSGDFINNGSFIHNNGRVSFVGATSTSVTGTANGTSTHNFYDVTINKSGAASITVPAGITNQVNNSMTLTNGIVNQNGTLNFLNGSSVSGANNTSYVNGQVVKYGTQAFTFPVGASNFYRPISISAPAVNTDNFSAQYFLSDPSSSYTHTSKDASIDHVGRAEYWILNRTGGISNVSVTLSWNTTSSGVSNLSDLLVARWDAGTGKWKDHGNGGTTGNTTAGTIITNTLITSFSPFTLASSTSNNILPIELLDFTAVLNDDIVNLNWSTATELNNNYFTVEKTKDGRNFEFVANVPGAGKSTTLKKYVAQDEKPYQGVSYYRLKQTDFDGKFKYSKIAVVDFLNDEYDLRIYPNPTNAIITIEFLEQLSPQSTLVSLTNVYGQQLSLNQIISKNQIKVDLSSLPSGIYFIGITLGEKTIARKIVLQK
jgi:autotransporter-associated beta strand protein